VTGSPWSDLLIDIAGAMLLAGHAGDRVVIVARRAGYCVKH
jgi:hypothetical protein